MNPGDVREAALFVTSPDGHLDDDRLQAAFALLRAKRPVCWVEPPGVRPFWLVTRHADVAAVERKGAPFAVAPRSFLSSEAGEACMRQVSGKPDVLRGLVQMDDPDHAAYRDIALPWFNPTWLAGLETWVADCAREAVARITGRTEVFDFAAEVAVTFPMRVTMHILGLPATDDQFILEIGPRPDRRGGSGPGAVRSPSGSRYGLPGSACATTSIGSPATTGQIQPTI